MDRHINWVFYRVGADLVLGGIEVSNPFAKTGGTGIQPVPRSQIFSDDQLCSMHTTMCRAEGDPKYVDPVFTMRLALGAGVRVSECHGIRVEDVTDEGKWVHIVRGKGGKARDIRVTPEFEPWLKLRLKDERVQESGWIFPRHERCGEQSIKRYWGYWQKALGLCNRYYGWKLPHLRFHSGRHTYASWEIAMGRLKVQELAANLGHSTSAVTEQYYLHMVRELVYSEDRRPQWIRHALGRFWKPRNFCSGCGADLASEHKFCPACGTRREGTWT